MVPARKCPLGAVIFFAQPRLVRALPLAAFGRGVFALSGSLWDLRADARLRRSGLGGFTRGL